jgi:peptidoglycan-N-acetylglucosamine deacetylase
MAKTYVTKEGDNLTTIAQEVYGDASRWTEIYEANKKTIGDDPNLIQVGAALTIPDAEQTYVTAEGDTLWAIAERFYKDGSRWPEIHEGNKKAIGDDPDKLGVGVTLKIPA